MLGKNIVIVSTFLLASFAIPMSAQTIAPRTISGDKDAYGCLIGAGYSWNESKKACTRPWEDRQGEQKNTREVKNGAEKYNATSTQNREENKGERAKKARKEIEKTMKHLDAAVARVKMLADRTASRIDKVSAQGVDVTAARKLLADARLKLDEARAKVEVVRAAVNVLQAAIDQPKDSEAMKNLKSLIKDASKTLQSAHRLVAQSVSSIKQGLNKEQPETTSATTTR